MNSVNKTFIPAQNYKDRNWFIIDCNGQTLGRLATIVTSLLKGKVKPHYYPSVDIGDYVILVNANLIILNPTSKHHLVYNPGRPGNSLKIRNVSDCLPNFAIEKSIRGMLSKTETKRLMRRLKIYTHESHPHKAQNPKKVNLANFYSTL